MSMNKSEMVGALINIFTFFLFINSRALDTCIKVAECPKTVTYEETMRTGFKYASCHMSSIDDDPTTACFRMRL